MIWLPHETEAWEPGKVLSTSNSNVVVKSLTSGTEYTLRGTLSQFDTVTAEALEEECDNLVNLESFSEGIILHHIKKRFKANTIYTFVGGILVALNPYKPLDIYSSALIDDVYEKIKHGKENIPPHVFSIGAMAAHNMRADLKDQSVLISGESGAGKTEATKRILQLISTVSGSSASRIGASIENQILDSNPLLESFGNAKTIRNNNSSRFGKYMEVNFDKRHNIKGCIIMSYLLEKTRVVKQSQNERNYHIFYMFLEGATREMKQDFQLKPADQFYYLLQSGCFQVDRRSDVKEFEEMLFSMNSLAIDYQAQNEIFRALSCVLHLGNLTFLSSTGKVRGNSSTGAGVAGAGGGGGGGNADEGSVVGSAPDCRRVAQLLGVDAEALETALCFNQSVIGGEKVQIALNPEKAVFQRDSLSKFIYGKLFDFIVMLVNNSLFRGKPGLNIGVLDIFGFEVFLTNSFEQLCINYCNERLQTFFNEVIFETEMKLYAEEALPCDDIAYQDNVGCVRLIDLRGAGIFAYLDAESVVPKGSDAKFASKLNQIFDETAATKSVYFRRNRKSNLGFIVCHFAGDVVYDCTDFLEKNRDTMAESLLSLLATSTVGVIQKAAKSVASGGASDAKGSGKRSSKQTLSSKFKSDLDNLMTTLRATVPHFIRCVKPNNDQKADQFEPKVALNQMKYSGLFEAIRIRKSGYAVRLTFVQFIQRYKHCLSEKSLPPSTQRQTNPGNYCTEMLRQLEVMVNNKKAAKKLEQESKKKSGFGGNLPSKNAKSVPSAEEAREQRPMLQWAVGKTKLFIRTQEFRTLLEEIRSESTANAVIPVQKAIRGYLARVRVRALMGQTLLLREEQRRQEAGERKFMGLEDALSAEVEEAWKEDFELQQTLAQARAERIAAEKHRKEERIRNAAVIIQKIVRGRLIYCKRGKIKMCENALERALLKRDEKSLRRAMDLPAKYDVSSKLIRFYQQSVKQLILAVLNEAYVNNQLEEAITVGAIELLKDAIKLTERSHMPYLPAYKLARAKLEQTHLLRGVLTNIGTLLSKAVTVPKLLASVDQLRDLVKKATSMGLGGEYQVQEAVMRMGKIKNLIVLRDKIRFSVEICSPSRMKNAIEERAKLLRIYGPDLCREEMTAVEGMLRMLNYQQFLPETTNHNNIINNNSNSRGGIGGDVSGGGAGGSHHNSTGGASSGEAGEGGDHDGGKKTEKDRDNDSSSSAFTFPPAVSFSFPFSSAELIPVSQSFALFDDVINPSAHSRLNSITKEEFNSAAAEITDETPDNNAQDSEADTTAEAEGSARAKKDNAGVKEGESDEGDTEQEEGEESINNNNNNNKNNNNKNNNNNGVQSEGEKEVEREGEGEASPMRSKTRKNKTEARKTLQQKLQTQSDGAYKYADLPLNDIYLPPFVRRPLEKMRAATSASELNEAVADLVQIVPSETKRKFHVRIFKWVVAFATWKFEHRKGEGFHIIGDKTGIFASQTSNNGANSKDGKPKTAIFSIDAAASAKIGDLTLEEAGDMEEKSWDSVPNSPTKGSPKKGHTMGGNVSPGKAWRPVQHMSSPTKNSPEKYLRGSGASSLRATPSSYPFPSSPAAAEGGGDTMSVFSGMSPSSPPLGRGKKKSSFTGAIGGGVQLKGGMGRTAVSKSGKPKPQYYSRLYEPGGRHLHSDNPFFKTWSAQAMGHTGGGKSPGNTGFDDAVSNFGGSVTSGAGRSDVYAGSRDDKMYRLAGPNLAGGSKNPFVHESVPNPTKASNFTPFGADGGGDSDPENTSPSFSPGKIVTIDAKALMHVSAAPPPPPVPFIAKPPVFLKKSDVLAAQRKRELQLLRQKESPLTASALAAANRAQLLAHSPSPSPNKHMKQYEQGGGRSVSVSSVGIEGAPTFNTFNTSKSVQLTGNATVSSSGKTLPQQQQYIPFAERQSRAQVASHQVIKKTKKLTYKDYEVRTDQLFHETIASYDKKKIKNFRPSSTF